MNIFAVHEDPQIAARMLPDKHVNKMILESAQMISLVYSDHYWGIGEVLKVDGTPFKTARGAFKKHPCTIWAADSEMNCAWLLQHAAGLCSEFVARYGKQHGLTKSIWEAKKLFHRAVGEPITIFTAVERWSRAMPEDIKFDDTIDDITAYRKYLNTKHWIFYNYLRKPDRKPDWLIQPNQ